MDLLFGLNDKGRIVHTEIIGCDDEGKLRVAAERLPLFAAVEVWTSMSRLVRLTRTTTPQT